MRAHPERSFPPKVSCWRSVISAHHPHVSLFQAHKAKGQCSPLNKAAFRKTNHSASVRSKKPNQQNQTKSFYCVVSFYQKITKNINIKSLENTWNSSVIFFFPQTGANLFVL